MNNTKFKSIHFKDHEIKGVLPDGSIYLKDGVKRKYYNDTLREDMLEPHINEELIVYQKAELYYKYIEGADDYENS